MRWTAICYLGMQTYVCILFQVVSKNRKTIYIYILFIRKTLKLSILAMSKQHNFPSIYELQTTLIFLILFMLCRPIKVADNCKVQGKGNTKCTTNYKQKSEDFHLNSSPLGQYFIQTCIAAITAATPLRQGCSQSAQGLISCISQFFPCFSTPDQMMTHYHTTTEHFDVLRRQYHLK